MAARAANKMQKAGQTELSVRDSFPEPGEAVANIRHYLSSVCASLLYNEKCEKSILEESLKTVEATDILTKFSCASEYSALMVECLGRSSGFRSIL